MSKGHGNRKHLQVLLAPYRGKLFIDHLESKNIKPTAFIRQMIYDYLSSNLPAEEYQEAKNKDDDEWQQSVQNRLQGRALSKLVKSIQNS